MKFTTENGKVYEFKGIYSNPKLGEYYLSSRSNLGSGDVKQALADHPRQEPPLAIVARVRPRHTFGGIVFEETGEIRELNFGEWGLQQTTVPCPFFRATLDLPFPEYPVLRPVALGGGA